MKAIKIDPLDNVAIAVQNTKSGETLATGDENLVVHADIPCGMKVALCDIAKGAMVIKYGVPIGEAAVDIARGGLVHVEEMKDITSVLCSKYEQQYRSRGGRS